MDLQLQKRALQQFKQLIKEKSGSDEISIWGVTLQLDSNHDKTNVILLKFLQAKGFKVRDAFDMFCNTIQWRKEFCIDKLLLEDEDDRYSKHLEGAFFMFGKDKENHPVCYIVFEVFHNDDLYHELFSDKAKVERFLKWRILFMEKAVRKLDFGARGVSAIVQVIDMQNSPPPHNAKFTVVYNSADRILLNHYPGLLKRQIIINVPWLHLALLNFATRSMTESSRSKFVFVGPSDSIGTLLRYVDKEEIPTRFEGLIKRAGESEEAPKRKMWYEAFRFSTETFRKKID